MEIIEKLEPLKNQRLQLLVQHAIDFLAGVIDKY